MCLSSPPRVIDDLPTVARSPAASRPEHFHASVARWKSRKPSRVSVSDTAGFGSGRPCSSRSAMVGSLSEYLGDGLVHRYAIGQLDFGDDRADLQRRVQVREQVSATRLLPPQRVP